MGAYQIGQLIGMVAAIVLIAWLVIHAVVKTVKFNIIRKRDGAEAAQAFWDAKKRSRR